MIKGNKYIYNQQHMLSELNPHQSLFYTRYLSTSSYSQIKSQMNQELSNLLAYSISDIDNFVKRDIECTYNDCVKAICTLVWNFRGYALKINGPIKKGKKSKNNNERRAFQQLVSPNNNSQYILLSGEDKKHWQKVLNPKNIMQHLEVADKILQKMLSVQVSEIESRIKFNCLIICLATMIIRWENLISENGPGIKTTQISNKQTVINSCLKTQIAQLLSCPTNKAKSINYGWTFTKQRQPFCLIKRNNTNLINKYRLIHFLTHVYYENDTQNLRHVNFGDVFNIYAPLLEHNMNSLQNVDEWVHLIRNIWMNIDSKNASKIFYKLLVSLSSNHTPIESLTKFKQQIIAIVQSETEEYIVLKQNQFVQRLNERLLQIGSGIVNLKVGGNEIQTYFSQELKKIKEILVQSSILKEKQLTLNRLKDKINKDAILDLKCIYQINETMASNAKTTKKKEAHFDENAAVKWFLENCPNKKEILNEISHFIKLAHLLKNIKEATEEDLFACSTFYQNKLATFMDEKLQINQINKLPFGIFDAIRIIFCSIILNYLNRKIRKQRRQQLSLRLQELVIVAFSKKGQAYFNPDQTQDDLNQSELQEFLCGGRQIKFNLVRNMQQFYSLSQQQYDNAVKLYKKNTDKDFQLIKILSSFGILSFQRLIEQHKAYQTSLRQNYTQTRKQLIKDFLRTIQNSQQRKQVEQLPIIEYYIAQENYLEVWKLLTEFKNAENIKLKLNLNVQDSLTIRIYLTILIKFRNSEIQQLLRQRVLDQATMKLIIDSIFKEFNEQLNGTYNQIELQKLRKKLSNSMIIYDKNEKLNRLQLTLKQNKSKGVDFRLNQYTVIPKTTKFIQIGQKLKISSVFRDNIEVCQRYELTLPNQQEFETVLKKINLYKQFTNGLTILNIQKTKFHILMEKNSVSQKFETLPNLAKSVVDDFYEIVEFTRKTLQSKLFPLMCNGNIKIHKKLAKYILDIDYTQSILFIMLIQASPQQFNLDRYYSNSKFPFFHLAENLYNPIYAMYLDLYITNFAKAYENNQFNEFNQFIEQMKAIEFEQLDYTTTTAYKRILKTPYLWTPSERFLQLVDFKEKLFSCINKEEKRRKYNYQTKENLPLYERENFVSSLPSQLRHQDYKVAHGYNKASQHLFSIEGIMEKQAFYEDIGNIGTSNKQFQYGEYKWYDKKHLIKQIIEIAVQQENQRWNDNQSVYDRTYPSFQNQIRCLRNMLVHSVFLRDNVALSLEQKIEIINENFPKLFTFIYRWKPLCGLDYFRQIKVNRVNLLKSVFKRQDNSEVIKTLQKDNNFNDYCFNKNYKNQKTVLLDMFHYNKNYTYECQQCNILCQSMKNTKGFWKFMDNVMREHYKDEKDNSFNILFWEHSEYGCNCAFNLRHVLRNILKRASITPEEMSFMTTEEYNAHNNQLAIKVQYSDEQLYQEFYDTDYVCKNFIFQLESQFPFLFDHLRKYRYVWDQKRLLEKPDA